MMNAGRKRKLDAMYQAHIKEGLTLREIAPKFGFADASSVWHALRSNGYSTRDRKASRKERPELYGRGSPKGTPSKMSGRFSVRTIPRAEEMERWREHGYTLSEIAAEFGYSDHTGVIRALAALARFRAAQRQQGRRNVAPKGLRK